MAPPLRFDVLILGAGLAGTSLAVALKSSRFTVGLVDSQVPARPAGQWDARVYAVSPASADFLRDIGIWRHLDPARLTPVFDMQIRGDAGGRLDFSAYDSGIGELAWIAENRLIGAELWETVKRQANVTLLCPARPRALALDPVPRVQLDDGRELEAALVVGADGADSWVRRAAGLSSDTVDCGEAGVVANFGCERPHRNTAFQWFRQDGVLAWLPLPGERISIVWSTPAAHAERLLALDAGAFAERVAQAGQARLGALTPLTPAAAFPLRHVRVPRIVAPGLALLGDAAHALHPLSGHGINLGFLDARSLARVLMQMPEFRSPGELPLLRRYERERAEEVLLLQTATHALQRLFAPRNPALALLRNTGLDLTHRLPLVRHMLVRYAVG